MTAAPTMRVRRTHATATVVGAVSDGSAVSEAPSGSRVDGGGVNCVAAESVLPACGVCAVRAGVCGTGPRHRPVTAVENSVIITVRAIRLLTRVSLVPHV